MMIEFLRFVGRDLGVTVSHDDRLAEFVHCLAAHWAAQWHARCLSRPLSSFCGRPDFRIFTPAPWPLPSTTLQLTA
ncbi:hypothetical protein WR25_16892 [Diploscapter pachys]|uniref:Uncharacterized protein n=1 Tax=Diploscapter pachys TaxID=2018661 RepID=A0A2A2LDR7_9BILA|nr:hypothetical protein WR25_16892 [Diploscapter pachys]